MRELRCLNPVDSVTEFVDELLQLSRGNQLYIKLLLDMIEQERIHLKATSISLLPADLAKLYLLHFNLAFPYVHDKCALRR